MTADADDGRMQRLDEVLRLVRAKVASPQRGVIEDFVLRYFRQVDPEELAERHPADLYGAALSHWNFARSTRRSKSMAGSLRIRSLRSSMMTCRSSSTR